MPEQRILFAKEGKSKYISHLDLMRTFQRVFIRAGVRIRHSEGFNPRPKLSIALPLSVGQESVCELLDFALEDGGPLDTLPERMTAAAPEGIRVLSAYDAERKIKELHWLAVTGVMEYDAGAPDGAPDRLSEFFARKAIVMQKRSKSGVADFDLSPCLRDIAFEAADGGVIMRAVITAQTPALNPEHLMGALRQLAPELAPDFTSFKRTDIYDTEGKIFR